jgi:hypothetical protein
VGETNAHYGDHYNWSSLADDCLVAKYNSSGTLQYQKFYGRNLTEWGIGVGTWYPTNEDYVDCEALSDGRFVAAGGTTNNGTSNNNFLLTAWNANGTVSWSKWISIDGTQNNTSSTVSSCGGALAGVDSSDNIYVLVNGGSSSTSHVMKFNSSGTVQWQKNIQKIFTNPFNNTLTSWSDPKVTKSGDIYLRAYRGSGNDHGIVKLNSNGAVQWTKSFPGNGSDTNYLKTDDQGNLWLLSYYTSLICVDSNGNIIRRMQITTSGAGGFTRGFTVDEGYITIVTDGRNLGPQTTFTRESNLAVFRFEISGVNNGSYTHTNSDGSTLTVTVSSPSTSSASSYSNPSVSNSSVSVINYPGNGSLRFNNGTCTNFTNSSPPNSSTLTV